MSRSPFVAAVQAAALSVLVAGTTAFVSLDKTVALTVDGKDVALRSFGRDVGEVLDREGVDVGPHDTVAPSLGTPVTDGTRIAVRHGRLLTLTLDGSTRQVWVTADDVSEALDQLGLRAQDAYLSSSRSRRIPLDGMSLELRTEREVIVFADHERHVVTTTAETVRGVLKDAGLTLGRRDKVSAPFEAFPVDGQVITVTRIGGKRVEENVEIPFTTVERKNPDMLEGETEIIEKGRPGMKVNVYDVRYVDGEETARRLVSSEVVAKPVTQVVEVGTKERSTGVEDLNWAALADCESGGNPKSYNPSGPYYGLYQFSQGTWESVGGSGIPTDASADEQTYRAQLLYQRSGAGQWPVCGKYLFE